MSSSEEEKKRGSSVADELKEAVGYKHDLDFVRKAIKLGPRTVMLQILEETPIVTKREIGTDREEIYCYAGGFYSRGEEEVRTRAKEIYIEKWKTAQTAITEMMKQVDPSDNELYKKRRELQVELDALLENGPKGDKIEEVLKQIRLETFTNPEEFNPPSHIPFRNGTLNLNTWQLEPHTPFLIYLWRVEADLLEDRLNRITINDCPMYKKFLLGSYEPWDIPILLQYGGYAFYPTFPRQVVLWIVGRPRIGKGTNARIWRSLNPTGHGAISFEKLMIAENRFAFQSVEGKNLLVDPEVKRKFKKGTRPDYGNFNKLFGGDALDLEKKGKQSNEYVSHAKGLFIANLPLPPVDDEPFIARTILVKARDNVLAKSEIIADLDTMIVNAERNEIATLFVRYLKILAQNNWNFISELTTDATMEMWELFANIVEFYLNEMVGYEEGSEIKCDDMYDSFTDWCHGKGIPPMKAQAFKKSVGYVYPKKRAGTKKNRYYVFTNCAFDDEIDLQVGHHSNEQENRDIRALYYRYERCPTWEGILNMREKKEKSCKIYIPKLDTEQNDSTNPIIQPSPATKTVSNMKNDPPMRSYSVISDFSENGFAYRAGSVYDWNTTGQIETWIREGKIREVTGGSPDFYDNYVPVLVLKDFDVAWTDRNWYLHEQDIVYLDEKLATMLIGRSIAKKVETK